MKRLVSVAHSPDPDDAFMFFGMVKGGILPEGWRVRHVLKDIQSLNRDARKGLHQVTAVSTGAYPSIADKYYILSVGASVGRGYGPVLVCRADRKRDLAAKDWSALRIATPGPETTALLLLRLAHPGFMAVDTRFDKIPDAVRKGKVDAGLVIHESQITFAKQGLVKVMDLGRWWHDQTGLPIPLGLDVVRKDMGLPEARRMATLLKKSIEFAYQNKKEAVAYALRYGRGVNATVGERFVKMYVNQDTLDMGPEGERALRTLFRLAWARRLIPKNPTFKIIHPERP
ncbi:MAG: ABC transporter substrate-binding protein [Elusimicrobia bacterium]|jgi:1,4-dihydroxy-6-naphthoate synthase|nr:ABC transporter substrate-binding protein [Elusimicrobiota bacterium]